MTHFAGVLSASERTRVLFHATFGYYAQGVSESSAILPEGWRDRLLRFESAATGGVVAWCLEGHDLWISKAIANREKDVDFCRALLSAGIVDRGILRTRLDAVPDLDEARRGVVARRIEQGERP